MYDPQTWCEPYTLIPIRNFRNPKMLIDTTIWCHKHLLRRDFLGLLTKYINLSDVKKRKCAVQMYFICEEVLPRTPTLHTTQTAMVVLRYVSS